MNYGDIKVITNKFWWKYLRQDKVNLIRSQSIASTINATFWWALQTQAEWVIFEPVKTHHLGLKAQNFENPLQRLLQIAKFLFMFSFTHISIVFLFRHGLTKIVIFLNVCYRMKCFSGVFPFLGAGFTNILPTFFISYEVQTRYSKH